MASLIIAITYLAFISLGLPDSLLGSGWPVMYGELQVSISYAGIISMIIAGGTIVSSLLSDWMTRKFGTGPVTAVSTLLTALALLGFSLSDSFWMLCLLGIPYGLGAGAIDAALNNYAALYFNARHMSWLHCFWGVGVSISPYIMSYCLTGNLGWQSGYRFVSVIQMALAAFLFLSLPLWKKRPTEADAEIKPEKRTWGEIFRIPGVLLMLVAFFGYCSIETTAGLWASSYLVEYRGLDSEIAARFGSFFYLGITFGRFVCGFFSEKLGDHALVRIGMSVMIFGAVLIILPLENDNFALAGLLILGFGGAPVYPSIIHSTPASFGAENSQAIIGVQMACAYLGCTLMPPVFGALSDWISIGLYPFFLLAFALLTLITAEKYRAKVAQKV